MDSSSINLLFYNKRKNILSEKGVLFETSNNKYFYDTGTSKVVLLDDFDYFVINNIINNESVKNFDDLVGLIGNRLFYSDSEVIQKLGMLDKFISDENLFMAPELKCLKQEGYDELVKEQLNNNMNQIILELTGKCNLRCKYCIYNDNYEKNRNFNPKSMTFDVAKKAIDYLNIHGDDSVSVTFYGGEPLLEFELLKKCIEYSREKILDKELNFSLTTNLTKMDEEKAKYLASVDNLSVVCSIDGPKYVHDSYRVYQNGKGSFEDAIKGLKYLVRNFKGKTQKISINAVFAPPYTYEKLIDINEFFSKLEWLPKNVNIDINYVSEGTVDDKSHLQELKKDSKYCTKHGVVDPLLLYTKNDFLKQSEYSRLSSSLTSQLIHIHDRKIFNEPSDIYVFNGCCIPGARRLYVTTEGEYDICERVGLSPSIGNVKEGIAFDKVKKYYLDEYSDVLTPLCKKCWAKRLCRRCYARSYNEKQLISENELNISCNYIREAIIDELELYHEIYENDPKCLDFLNDIEIF